MRGYVVGVVGVVVGGLAGCGTSAAPLTAGGKPVAHWIAQADSPDPKVRVHAVKELSHVGAADPAALPAVAKAVKDKDAAVRREAVLGLLNNGPAAKAAVPVLADAAESDPDKTVREYAAKAVEKIGGK